MPNYAKFGDLALITGGTHLTKFMLDEVEGRQEAHQLERNASTLNKNPRRQINPMKHRRKYWQKEREEL